jgi:glyoxylase-like metal-dependent hydrolase (beta-lactamase superfamily II)
MACAVKQRSVTLAPMTTPSLTLGPVTVYFGEKTGKYPDGNQVIVRGADTTLAFDMPLVCHRLGPVIGEIDAVVLGHAHEDHQTGLGLVRDKPVWAPRGDLQAVRSWQGMARHYGYRPSALQILRQRLITQFHFVERPDAQPYDDDQTWDLGGGVRIRAIHMPGHTTGHSVLLIEPGPIAFIGDIDLTSFGPYYGDASSDLSAFRRSLARVAQLDARAWITFHHKGVIQERETFLQLLAAYSGKIDAREQAILDFIGAEPIRLETIRAHRFVYPPGYEDVFIDDVESRTLALHLEELLFQGRLILEEGFLRRA